jgi:hypothetical protein
MIGSAFDQAGSFIVVATMKLEEENKKKSQPGIGCQGAVRSAVTFRSSGKLSKAKSASCTRRGSGSGDFSQVMIVCRDFTPSAIRSVSWVKPLRFLHSGSSVPSIGRLHNRLGLFRRHIEAGILSKNWTSTFWTFWFDSRIEASETARETVFGIIILRP